MQVTQGDFWQSAASDLLGPLLHAAAIGHRGIEDVTAWLSDPSASQAQGVGGSVIAFGTPLALLYGAHGSEDAKTAARTLRGATVGTAAETMLSFCNTARVALKVFSTRAGIASTRQQPGIDFDGLIDSDDTIYKVGTEDDQSRPCNCVVCMVVGWSLRRDEYCSFRQRLPPNQAAPSGVQVPTARGPKTLPGVGGRFDAMRCDFKRR